MTGDKSASQQIFDMIDFSPKDKSPYWKHVLKNFVIPAIFYIILGLICIKWEVWGLAGICLLTGFILGRIAKK